MKDKNHEEIRQILSIVNYKIILYSLLIQNTKGVAQTYRKITGCIHAMSAILGDDAVLLFLSLHSSPLSCRCGRRISTSSFSIGPRVSSTWNLSQRNSQTFSARSVALPHLQICAPLFRRSICAKPTSCRFLTVSSPRRRPRRPRQSPFSSRSIATPTMSPTFATWFAPSTSDRCISAVAPSARRTDSPDHSPPRSSTVWTPSCSSRMRTYACGGALP